MSRTAGDISSRLRSLEVGAAATFPWTEREHLQQHVKRFCNESRRRIKIETLWHTKPVEVCARRIA